VFLGSRKSANASMMYEMPANVISMEEIYLFEPPAAEALKPKVLPARLRNEWYDLLEKFYFSENIPEGVTRFFEIIDWLDRNGDIVNLGNLFHDEEAWWILSEQSRKLIPHSSFIDFFWTCRFLHMPIWQVIMSRHRMPPAKMYHSLCTGYAGAISSLAARKHGASLMLTEHGIYTKERIMEITQADWIYEPETRYFEYSAEGRRLKEIWIKLFEFLGAMTYQSSRSITSLFDGNARLQIEFGAPPGKIQIIPNGIRVERFNAARDQRLSRQVQNPKDCVVGFVGRVVPIKDVKTLLRAAEMLVSRLPTVRFEFFGPTEEDPEYYAECMEMVLVMKLTQKVTFHGMTAVEDAMARIDVMVLTSISEGQPLVMLEAFAAGIPVVATDVGSCRELINGRTPEDRSIGRAGLLTGISSPVETSVALNELLISRERQNRMGEAGRQRVEQFYRQEDIMTWYRDLYGLMMRPVPVRNVPDQSLEGAVS